MKKYKGVITLGAYIIAGMFIIIASVYAINRQINKYVDSIIEKGRTTTTVTTGVIPKSDYYKDTGVYSEHVVGVGDTWETRDLEISVKSNDLGLATPIELKRTLKFSIGENALVICTVSFLMGLSLGTYGLSLFKSKK
ncbi:hypothetical protein D3C81_08140 [compost metagenome]